MYPISLGDNLKISNVIVTVVSTYYHSLWILYRMSLVLLNKCSVSLSVSWVSTVLFMTLHTLMKCTVIVVAVKNTDKSGNSSNSSTTSSDTSTSLLSGSSIFTYESSSITGPWSIKNTVYTTPETGGNIWTYNAFVHPEFDSAGFHLLSYNVNSLNTNDLFTNADNYRPKFIWFKY